MAGFEIRRDQVVELAVPRPRWTKVALGAPAGAMARRLKRQKFDQAPVVDRDSRPIGIVWTSKLEELGKSEAAKIARGGEVVLSSLWRVGESVDALLELLAQNRAALISDSDIGDSFGLISISDLSWPEFRSILYPTFCSLEHHLALWVAKEYKNPWEWIRKLPLAARPQIVGHWGIARKEGVETSATVGANLSDLLQVVETTESMRLEISPELSKRKAEGVFKGIKDLRNRIAHPTRPLVSNCEQVKQLIQDMRATAHLEGRVSEIVKSKRSSPAA